MRYFICLADGKKLFYFLNICGNYSLTENKDIATSWDEEAHKEMWYFYYELRASTNKDWIVIDEEYNHLSEPEEARRFIAEPTMTIENCEKEIVLEKETFNSKFNSMKPKPDRVYYSELRIGGEVKYLPIAEVNGKYYRYKHCLDEKNIREDMWKW